MVVGHRLSTAAFCFAAFAGQVAAWAQATPEPALATDARLTLEVLLVNDPDLPPVTPADANTILAEAKATVLDKLGYDNLAFVIEGSITVKAFIDKNTEPDDGCLARLAPMRVGPAGRPAKEIPDDVILAFLKQWSLEELQAFFPEARRASLGTYEAIVAALKEELDKKLALIESFKLEGKSLLAPDKLEERSYVRWICAMRHQDEADIVLTNAFVLYDLGSEPYPHSIFTKNKVGGASVSSPKRTAIRGRAIFASTFSMMTHLPFFHEEGAETLTPQEKLQVIGTFIVAHELGHALFKLPDFYDHPDECLMTTKFHTGYVNGFRFLKENPGACSGCQPYVDAREKVFLAHAAQAKGEHAKAIALLKEAIRKTPKHVDGSYLRYMADLSVDIAESYIALGELKQANRWLKSALRVVKHHHRAEVLKAKLGN